MKRDALFTVALCVMLLGSVLLNLIQANKLRVKPRTSPDTLETGIGLNPLKVKDLTGRMVTIEYRSYRVPTILYVFSPGCHWCDQNLAAVRQLASATGKRYRFIGLSLAGGGGLDAYLRDHNLGIQAYYTSPTPEGRKEYHMWSTPTTFVISSTGRLMAEWVGAYVGTNRTEIERFFSLGLPDVATKGSASTIGDTTGRERQFFPRPSCLEHF